ncbi:hypothetical protein GCM10010299_51170 [Streptomyces tanashiensis]|nr:hypothetical protein GCM10010299_51170 [Streptomyces tanashiensis]
MVGAPGEFREPGAGVTDEDDGSGEVLARGEHPGASVAGDVPDGVRFGGHAALLWKGRFLAGASLAERTPPPPTKIENLREKILPEH